MVLRNSHGNLTGDKVYRETVERHGRQTEKKLGCGEGDKRRQSSACSCRTPPQLCHDQSLGGGPAWTQPPRAPGPTRPLSKPIDQSRAGVCRCCPEGSNPHVLVPPPTLALRSNLKTWQARVVPPPQAATWGGCYSVPGAEPGSQSDLHITTPWTTGLPRHPSPHWGPRLPLSLPRGQATGQRDQVLPARGGRSPPHWPPHLTPHSKRPLLA